MKKCEIEFYLQCGDLKFSIPM